MSRLREKRRVTGPTGTWELYVIDAETGRRTEAVRTEPTPPGGPVSLPPDSRPDLSQGSSAIHIEAINRHPRLERLLWTTTGTSLERVLDEIEEGLMHGRVVQPAGAFYSGARGDDSAWRPTGFVFPDVPVAALDSVRRAGMEAYGLFDQLPRGPARRAAWNAFALQTYGDKLLAATNNPGFVSQDSAEIAGRLFSSAVRWFQEASRLSEGSSHGSTERLQDVLPRWSTPTRSHEQLVGMRETLETLRTHIAYDLANPSATQPEPTTAELRERLAAVDKRIEEVALLWTTRPPAELRRGIGYALSMGLDEAHALGQALAS